MDQAVAQTSRPATSTLDFSMAAPLRATVFRCMSIMKAAAKALTVSTADGDDEDLQAEEVGAMMDVISELLASALRGHDAGCAAYHAGPAARRGIEDTMVVATGLATNSLNLTVRQLRCALEEEWGEVQSMLNMGQVVANDCR
jgi:hypothetical protein